MLVKHLLTVSKSILSFICKTSNMSRIPKWLMLKEHLTFDDVTKLLDSTPSSIENILAHDCSEEFGLVYKFMCTFNPQICQKEFKEYRFESVARQSIRAHLKDHINDMKTNSSEEARKAFTTKNQLFKSSKNVTNKHKITVSNEVIPGKKQRSSVKNEPEPSHLITGKEQKKPKTPTFTKLKKLQKDKILSGISYEENEDDKQEENINIKEELVPEKNDWKVESQIVNSENSFEDDENTTGDKMDAYSSDDGDGGEKISCETQTDHAGKEQETLQYKIATKLFAVDRSFWNNIEQILDDIVDAEKSSELLSQADKDMILKGMRQWMDSVQIYDKHAMSRLQDPLTQAERTTLNGLTVDDWKKLEKGQDNESKLRLTVYANMLLRDYESYPRKLKPKYCQHCEKLYTASTSLYSHLVSLAGIRHWVCSRCKDANKIDATFTRKHSLQYHILKEVGIPRYRCQQPGCNRTHNHTHHQKSHARQHTGEKHYVCTVDGCKNRFSNRNTYSRHLLQFHHVELTRTNQLRAIDEKEAASKVNAARLKARERSKCKRQQGSDGSRICSNHEQDIPDVPKKRTIDENILNAAQHFLSEVKQEEGKFSEPEELSSKLSFEKGMRHSASQLLSGIARDFGSTTSLMAESKSPENMMGGLNLLATVSKYMNAKSSTKIDKSAVSEIVEQCAAGEEINHWNHSGKQEFPNLNLNPEEKANEAREEQCNTMLQKKVDLKQTFPKMKVMAIANVKLLSSNSKSSSQHSKLMQVIHPPFGQPKTVCPVQGSIEMQTNMLSQSIKLPSSNNVLLDSISKSEHTDSNSGEHTSSDSAVNANISVNYDLTLSSSTEPLTGNNLMNGQSGSLAMKNPFMSISHAVDVMNENKNSLTGNLLEATCYVKETLTPNTKSLTMSRNTTPSKLTSPSVQSSGNCVTNQKSFSTINSSSVMAQSLAELCGHSSVFGGVPASTGKTPLAALTSNTSMKCDSSLPGRIVAEAQPCNHLTSSNKINLTLASTGPNQTPNKNIQVIKVTNTAAQLQLRSVSCMSGKTYLVLTSSAAHSTASTDGESSTSSRILPFSEL